jgi:hypothetical protein
MATKLDNCVTASSLLRSPALTRSETNATETSANLDRHLWDAEMKSWWGSHLAGRLSKNKVS